MSGPLLSRTALAVFRAHGRLLELSEDMARPVGLTAARWQVLGAVLRDPLPVSGVARAMGMTRQGVQRIADLLVEQGLAAYRPNPAHRRAKLLVATEAGVDAVQRVTPAHRALAADLADRLGDERFAEIAAAVERLAEALDTLDTTTPAD
ncbi:MarR family winged helix-turn-helix transcriptional regulator [Actinokineospora auranticolor]|uniref:DNA-binding MarR family transcriptional regulator n=1 Tax=Actinokineospora auranticolor TaxID=155976 RepID=A0A2S6GCV6_9PSEU|nr:MarR family winged helix-turn-helix transcriptional regulator [Actinokineospora auranticolor]PPK62767.1 DNA-binding MarR family transcriptional regulator [Actinokineospora auranticolor]